MVALRLAPAWVLQVMGLQGVGHSNWKAELPCGSVVKNPPASAGDMGLIPRAAEQLSPCAAATESVLWGPGAATPEASSPRACTP